MSKSLEIEITEAGNVTLHLIERNYWGSIWRRRQFTVSSLAFERALKKARITVPWDRVRA